MHIGKNIYSVFNQTGLTVSQFARMVEIQRTRIYSIFESKTIDVMLLCKISDVLHYDFLQSLKSGEVEKQNSTIINIQFQIVAERLADFIKQINRLKKAGLIE